MDNEEIALQEQNVQEETAVEPLKEYSFLELVYGIFFAPVRTLGYISTERKILWGILLFLGTYLFDSLMNLAVGRAHLPDLGLQPEEAQFVDVLLSRGWLWGLPFVFAFWFTLISIYHSLAGLFKSKGTVQGLLAGFGFSTLPLLISSVIGFLGHVLNSDNIVFNLLGFAIFVWIVVLQVICLKENYQMSYGKAILIYFVPMIFFLISLISFLILLFSTLAPLFKGIAPGF